MPDGEPTTADKARSPDKLPIFCAQSMRRYGHFTRPGRSSCGKLGGLERWDLSRPLIPSRWKMTRAGGRVMTRPSLHVHCFPNSWAPARSCRAYAWLEPGASDALLATYEGVAANWTWTQRPRQIQLQASEGSQSLDGIVCANCEERQLAPFVRPQASSHCGRF